MYVKTAGLYAEAVKTEDTRREDEVVGKTEDARREDEIAVYRAAIRILRQQKLDLQYKGQSLLKTIALMQRQLAIPAAKDVQMRGQ